MTWPEVEVTRQIARDVVEIRRARRIRLPDAVIWATAHAESALLVTRNTKDFLGTTPASACPIVYEPRLAAISASDTPSTVRAMASSSASGPCR